MTPETKSIRLLTLAGFSSSLLTIAAEAFVGRVAGGTLVRSLTWDLYPGLLFGGSIAAYFALHERSRSLGRVVAFVAASAAAYLVSMSVSFFLFSRLPRPASSGSPDIDIPLPVFFGGGFAGAFLILSAALLLYRGTNVGRRFLMKVPAWAAAGGMLGMIGWASGPLLGRPLLRVLQALGLRPSWETYAGAISQNVPEYLSLYVVWQTGVALSLGLMMSREAASAGAATTSASQGEAVAPGRSRQAITAVVGAFFLGVFAFLGWHVWGVIQQERAVARRMDAYKTSVAEAPSLRNLPPVEPMALDQALILEDLGGLFVEMPFADSSSLRGVPPRIMYSVAYVPQKDAPFGTYQPMVRVFVEQFPNVAWARYKTKYPSTFTVSLDDPKSLTTMTKFGHQIVMNTLMRSPDGNGALYFLWPSGNIVVLISYEEMKEVNEEFLKRYLDRYPSSL